MKNAARRHARLVIKNGVATVKSLLKKLAASGATIANVVESNAAPRPGFGRVDYIPVAVYRLSSMTLKDLKSTLALHPEAIPRFILPGGGQIPAHFHITEVGHITKRFIDYGGKLHERKDTCLLQTYVADDVDHRLNGGTFAKILQLGDQVLPHADLDVEVEYDCCVVAQYPLEATTFTGQYIDLQLGQKQTDCLARERCGIGGKDCVPAKSESLATTGCC